MGVLTVDPVKTIVQVITAKLLRLVTRVRGRPTLLCESAIVTLVEELLVFVHLGTSCHLEQRLLVLGVLSVLNVELDQQLLVLLLKKVEPSNLLLKILPESLVGKDKLLDRGVLLAGLDVCHLVAVNHTLEHLDLLPQGGLIGSLGCQDFKFFVLLLENIVLDTLFLDDALQLLNGLLELGGGLGLLSAQFHSVSRLLGQSVTLQFLGVRPDFVQF